jgi:hypothetical protein
VVDIEWPSCATLYDQLVISVVGEQQLWVVFSSSHAQRCGSQSQQQQQQQK